MLSRLNPSHHLNRWIDSRLVWFRLDFALSRCTSSGLRSQLERCPKLREALVFKKFEESIRVYIQCDKNKQLKVRGKKNGKQVNKFDRQFLTCALSAASSECASSKSPDTHIVASSQLSALKTLRFLTSLLEVL